MFIVHFAFIVLIVGMFGVLSLAFPHALTQRTPLGALVAGGLTLFWGVRLLMQHFVYSRTLWRGHRRRTIAHVLFTLLLAYFTTVYAAAGAWQLS